MDYLKVWTDFIDVLSPLQDDETGRLFRAMLHYARTGAEPDSFIGNERFVWAVAKRDIDNAAKRAQVNSANGSKGGRPKANETEEKQPKAKESEINQTEANERRKEKKGKEIEKKGKETESFIDDEDALRIAQEQNTLLDAAEKAGFARSDAIRGKLVDLYAVYGLDRILTAIDACVTHGVTTIAYLNGVLSDKPRQTTGKKTVAAQEYTQRDYSNEQEEAMKRFLAERGSA